MKGYHGETCAQAIRDLLAESKRPMTFTKLWNKVKTKGDWRDDAIWQHLMALVVNLPPAKKHWKSAKPFLFLHGDGTYEFYNPKIHPKVKE